MDQATPAPHDREEPPNRTGKSPNGAGHAGTSNLLIINNEVGYPGCLAISRYLQDLTNVPHVQRLVWAVLGAVTDGRLHYSRLGTFLGLRGTAQTRLWGSEVLDVTLLVDLVPRLNQWINERVGILKGKRGVASRIAKSDETLDEFGYPNLRGTLLSLAGRTPKKVPMFDVDGAGGVLEIPPRVELVPLPSANEPVLPEGVLEVRRIERRTQFTDAVGTVVDGPRAPDVVEGGRARVYGVRRASLHSRRAQGLHVVQPHQEQGDGQVEEGKEG